MDNVSKANAILLEGSAITEGPRVGLSFVLQGT